MFKRALEETIVRITYFEMRVVTIREAIRQKQRDFYKLRAGIVENYFA